MRRNKNGYYRKALTHPITGKRVYITAKSNIELLNKIQDWQEMVKKEGAKTFETVSEEWWRVDASRLQPSTQAGYNSLLQRINQEWGNVPITDIKTSDISIFLNHLKRLGYAKKTVKNHLIVISRIMHYAVIEGYIPSNPARDVELPRGLTETKRTAATPQEEARIKEAGNEVWLLPVTAIYTGMRKGELIGLRWEDIDLEGKTITVRRSVWYGDGERVIKEPKTKAGIRTIPIVAPLLARLQEAKKTAVGAYVFGTDKPLPEKTYRLMYARFQGQTGVTCTLHQLRKSFATYAVSKNLPPDVLKAILGHADISTTLNIYAETRQDRIQEAASLLEE